MIGQASLNGRHDRPSLDQGLRSALAGGIKPPIDAGLNLGARQVGCRPQHVGGAKVAALGLRVKGGCCYHGVALNVDMELEPYSAINPCGYPGMKVTQLRDLGVETDWARVGEALLEQLERQLEQ